MKRMLILLTLFIAPMLTLGQNVGDYISDGVASGTVFYTEPPTDTSDGIVLIVSDDIFIDSASTSWGCYGQGLEGNLSTWWGNAPSNGNEILSSCSGETASSLIQSYGTTGEHPIWYLPTLAEFEIMYETLHTIGKGNFSGMYWLSYVSTNDHMHVYGNDTVYWPIEGVEPDYEIYDTHAFVYDFDEPNFIFRPKTKLKTDNNNYKPFRGVRYITMPSLGQVTDVREPETKISVFPNPTKSNVNVPTPSNYNTYSILDFKGAEVLNGATTMTNTIIDLGGLSKGAYIIRLMGKEDTIFTRVIVR